jgi:hypothetical protein
MSEMLSVRFTANREGDAIQVVLAAQESGADPKLVHFGVVDTLLCLIAPEHYVHLLRAFSGRCQLGELIELLVAYVLSRTYIHPFGRS